MTQVHHSITDTPGGWGGEGEKKALEAIQRKKEKTCGSTRTIKSK